LRLRQVQKLKNTVTTTDKLFGFAEQDKRQADSATKEALRYRTALKDGFSSLKTRPLSTATAVAVCRTTICTTLQPH